VASQLQKRNPTQSACMGQAATEEEEAQGSLHPAGLLLKFFFEGCSAFFTVNSVASLVQSDFSWTRHAPPIMQVSHGRTKLFANRLARISGPSTPTPAPAPTPLAPATDSACSFDALIFDWPPIVLAGIMSTI
jgi:hypothetical protein